MLEEAKKKQQEQAEQAQKMIALQMAEESAKQKLREAEEVRLKAEASQKAQVASVFAEKNMKKQFRMALQTKNHKLIEEIAAKMLQNAWAGRKARKKVKLLKAERERLLREGYARKVQCRFRAHVARKKVNRLRAEKQRLREGAAAIKLQCSWRIRKARRRAAELRIKKRKLLEEASALLVQSAWRMRKAKKTVNELKAEKIAMENKKKAWEAKVSRSMQIIGKLLHAHHARQRYKAELQQTRHILLVRLERAHDVLIADVNSSDPYVLVHVDNSLNASTISPQKGRLRSGSFRDNGRTLSVYKSKIIYNTLNPVWNEDCMAVMNNDPSVVSVLCNLVLTVMDKDNFSSDDFLGQVI
jgi:hypothetical protein